MSSAARANTFSTIGDLIDGGWEYRAVCPGGCPDRKADLSVLAARYGRDASYIRGRTPIRNQVRSMRRVLPYGHYYPPLALVLRRSLSEAPRRLATGRSEVAGVAPVPSNTMSTMSVLMRQIARYVARRAASDPELRAKALGAAQSIFVEAKQIAREDNRAYAAGRAFRRAVEKLRTDR
jgi:hypothetical protein